MTNSDFSGLHQKVLSILDSSDKIFLDGLNNTKIIDTKLDINVRANIVTEYDKKVEDTLVELLSKAFPDYGFITEELADREIKEWNWIIDPIDGTFNYAHGIHICGTSIALWKGNEPQYGIFSFPTLKERFHGFKGGGIYVNGERVASQHKRATNYPYSILSCLAPANEIVKVCEILARNVSYPNTYGASIYNLYLTQTHKADITLVVNNEIWDVANAELFAHEAGLYVEFPWDRPDIHASKRDYGLSVIIGEEELVKKVSQELKKTVSHGRDILRSRTS